MLDLNLPDGSGLECFERIKEIDRRIPVIFITGHGTVESAIEATKQGAFDYLFKPLELPELKQLVARAIRLSEMVKTAPAVNPDETAADGRQAMVGRCESMQEIYKAIGRVAARDITVLIQGESGTGKELVAKALYQHSLRNKGPFRALNCGQFRKHCWKVKCLVTKRDHSPEQIVGASAISNRLITERCFWTKSATCHL